jgi:hypothetical protein
MLHVSRLHVSTDCMYLEEEHKFLYENKLIIFDNILDTIIK